MSMPDRDRLLASVRSDQRGFDLVVIGGGITGAGIAREAAGSGLRTLLVEQRDFAWGTSSRSSKMVHGGLRYLAAGQFGLTRDAVRERQRLLAEAPGLVEAMQFLMPHYRRQFPGPRVMGMLLRLYDALAGRRSRRFLPTFEVRQWAPGIEPEGLTGASAFTDAVTDDARLVLRLLAEARSAGALCLNYVRAAELIRDGQGQVCGVSLMDDSGNACDGASWRVRAPLVINATGAWADQLRSPAQDGSHIRPLRGSHLVLPFDALPVACAISTLHPQDRRPVFAFPWLGRTVLGTTDLDHHHPLDREPVITDAEVDYLLEAAARLFPGRAPARHHILSTWAGVRPVVSEGKTRSASGEKREHRIWREPGLVSVAGGKLTTFRTIAREVLAEALSDDHQGPLRHDSEPVFPPPPALPRPADIGHLTWRRLQGWYGPELAAVLEAGPLDPVAGTDTLWAEVDWAIAEQPVHLDDLMLRRTRLGLILAHGGEAVLPELEARCRTRLGWSGPRWQAEVERYRALWREAYFLPDETDTGAPS